MRPRLALAVGLVGLLAMTAGCSVLGPGQPNQEQLAADADYDWNTSANATVDVSKNSYTAVLDVRNRSTVELYRVDGLGTENPLPLTSVQFRYPNGTVVDASNIAVSRTQKRTVVELPAGDGQFAYTASRSGKRFSMPTFVEGSYELTLPPGARVGVPLLSQVSPGGYRTTVEADRVTIRWASVERGSIRARYYLQRDLFLFGGLLGVMVVAGVIGAAYYLRQIRALERQREEVGLDVDTEDDEFRDDPPPGMR